MSVIVRAPKQVSSAVNHGQEAPAFFLPGACGWPLWSPVFLIRFSPLVISSGRPEAVKVPRGTCYLQLSHLKCDGSQGEPGMAQMVEHTLSVHEVLGSVPSTSS